MSKTMNSKELRFNKFLDEALIEMCNRVGVDFNKLDFSIPDWFREHSWTVEEEADYRKWLIKLIRTKGIHKPEFQADMFLLTYGWVAKNEVVQNYKWVEGVGEKGDIRVLCQSCPLLVTTKFTAEGVCYCPIHKLYVHEVTDEDMDECQKYINIIKAVMERDYQPFDKKKGYWLVKIKEER